MPLGPHAVGLLHLTRSLPGGPRRRTWPTAGTVAKGHRPTTRVAAMVGAGRHRRPRERARAAVGGKEATETCRRASARREGRAYGEKRDRGERWLYELVRCEGGP